MPEQVIIEITPDKYFPPGIIEEARELEREVYFSRLVSKSVLTEAEQREYENFLQEFKFEDDTPVDNVLSEKNQKLLTRSLYASWRPATKNGAPRKFLTFANVGIFSRLRSSIAPIVPDVLVSLDVDTATAKISDAPLPSYLVWEYDKVPDIVVEIVSNRIGGELNDKLDKYAQLGIKYYAVFDPAMFITEDALQIFELKRGQYRLKRNRKFPEFGLQLTLWDGRFENFDFRWLRWLDHDGKLLLTGEERARIETERANAAAERANAAAERANAEAERANAEAERAHIETERADEESARADNEATRRVKAEERAAKLTVKLRELGLDPANFENGI